MAAASILHFRLRFARALGVMLGLSLALGAADARAGEYIVQMEKGADVADGSRLVARLGGRVTSAPLDVINGFGASLGENEAARLAADAGVRAVSPNAGVSTSSNTSQSTSGGYRCPDTDATTVASTDPAGQGRRLSASAPRNDQPLQRSVRAYRAWWRADGAGVGVAVVDTGIAGDLPDFGTTGGTSRVIASAVTNPCATDANDHFGHGTHVAGLIAGNGLRHPWDSPLHGSYMGMAPRANLISVKTSDDDGNTTVLDVINGIQFAVDHRAQFGIRVLNLSLSSTVAESYRTDPLDAAVESAWFSGLVVVAAAGNEGTAPDAVSYAPGNDPYVITVGAFDDRGTWDRGDDVVAPWSSRGVTQDGVPKPEMVGPGARLVAALAPGSDYADLCPSCVVEERYFRAGGTSMSAAVVSGIAALVVDAHPDWSPDQVKGALTASLEDVAGTRSRVNAADALDVFATANVDLIPSDLVDRVTGLVDWKRASFRRASFRDASGSAYDAAWTRASFRCDCSLMSSGEVEPARASFRRASFRRTTDFDE